MTLQEAHRRRSNALEIVVSAAAVIALLATAASGSNVLYVDDDAPPGGLGTTWDGARRSLQDALESARQAGSGVTEIRIAQGVYHPDDGESEIKGNRFASFVLESGLTLRGGFAGGDGTIGDMWNPTLYRTVLSGDLNDDDGPGFANAYDNSYHVVRITEGAIPVAGSRPTMLDGFVIRGGNADAPFIGHDRGAGLLITDASPIVVNCTFEENYAAQSGAGAASINGSPRFEDVFFDRNVAQISSAGLYLEYGAPEVTHAIFENNAAGGAGGGIGTLYSSLLLVNATFYGNNAAYGGAMWNHGMNEPELVNVTLNHNFAQLAGGIFNSFGAVRITNSILWGNWDYTGTRHDTQICGDAIVTWSIVQGGWPGAGGVGNIHADPLLDSNLRLSAGSPAIDAGNNLAVPADIVTDLAGNDRFVDDPNSPDVGEPGDSPALTPIVDMGAYERPVYRQKKRRNGGGIGID